MEMNGEAFDTPIEEGYARILLKIDSIIADVDNKAPDFISPEEDQVSLFIDVKDSEIEIPELDKTFSVSQNKISDDKKQIQFTPNQPRLWFDIHIDEVKEIWVADLLFSFESNWPKYVTYYIKDVVHHFEWLQPDLKSGEIKSLSLTTKNYKAPKTTGKESFSYQEVIRCADMIARAINKIDLRTNGALVKFNTDNGRLEPLIIEMGEKLGYYIEALPLEEVRSLEQSGKNVSHSIYLSKQG